MRRHLKYLKYVLVHKYFVFIFGVKLGVPLFRLIIHDWTKFLPGEWLPYARCFYAPDGKGQYIQSLEFLQAWNDHQKRHPHHWQYWILIMDTGDGVAMNMPLPYRREMLADWRGAGAALGSPDTRAWYLAKGARIILHPDTRKWIEEQLHVAPGESPTVSGTQISEALKTLV